MHWNFPSKYEALKDILFSFLFLSWKHLFIVFYHDIIHFEIKVLRFYSEAMTVPKTMYGY